MNENTHEVEAAQAYSDGATLRELAIRFGVAHQTVRKWVANQGVKMRSPGQPKKKNQLPNRYSESDVLGALSKGITVTQIARHLKVRPTIIYKIARSAARG